MQKPIHDQNGRQIRRLNKPNEIGVRYDHAGEPTEIQLRPPYGAWMIVSLNRLPWRIDQHWWRADQIARSYFEVAPEGAPVLIIYLDEATGVWYRQPYSSGTEVTEKPRKPLPPAKEWRSPVGRRHR